MSKDKDAKLQKMAHSRDQHAAFDDEFATGAASFRLFVDSQGIEDDRRVLRRVEINSHFTQIEKASS